MWVWKCSSALQVRKACSEWGSPGVGPPLLELFLFFHCFWSQKHLTLCCRAKARFLPFCSLGILKTRHFARVCTSTEQIITHRSKLLCAFSFAIFGLISYAKLFAPPLKNCLSIAWIVACFSEKCAVFCFRLLGLFLLQLLQAKRFSASASLLLCCHASLKLAELQVSHL